MHHYDSVFTICTAWRIGNDVTRCEGKICINTSHCSAVDVAECWRQVNLTDRKWI